MPTVEPRIFASTASAPCILGGAAWRTLKADALRGWLLPEMLQPPGECHGRVPVISPQVRVPKVRGQLSDDDGWEAGRRDAAAA